MWNRLASWWRRHLTTFAGQGNAARAEQLPWLAIATTFAPIFTAAQWATQIRLAQEFLQRKRFWGAAGLTVTSEMAATVAFGAACFAHRYGIGIFDDFVGLILYPTPFQVERRQEESTGVIHEWVDILEGETWAQGPVVLSWLADPRERWAVILHELAHRFDAAMGGLWDATWEAAWQRAESDPATLPFAEEALEDPAEFIAYSAESFFLDATGLKAWDLGLYSHWCRLTDLDPAATSELITLSTRKESLP